MERKDRGFDTQAIRLNRFLAMAGICSRRKADDLVRNGEIQVNGSVMRDLGVKIVPGKDKVVYEGNEVVLRHKMLYILFNKPKDCITTASDEKGRTTVLDYVKVRERIFPVGRLDRNTTGVLLLTNDGILAHKLMHPRNQIERVYVAGAESIMHSLTPQKLTKGIRLEDGMAKAHEAVFVPQTRKRKIMLSLGEGRNHEVRRMFEALEIDIRSLDRVSYAGITYRGLARGKWRPLTSAEIHHLELAVVGD